MRTSAIPLIALLLPSLAAADDVDSWRKDLRSPDEYKSVEAAEKLAEDLSPRAFDAILDELSVGAPPRVQGLLLAGLAARKDAHAIDVLSFYAHSRYPDIRKKALVALAVIPDPRPVTVLIGALSDPSKDVRAAAARGLGARKEHSAEAPLIKLLKHQDEAAVEALGAVGGPDAARELGEMLRQNLIPFPLLAETLGELLKRPDFGPDPIRVDVVNLLGKVPGNDAATILKDYLTATASDKTRPSRAAAEKVLSERATR